jgi:hypothetical protein
MGMIHLRFAVMKQQRQPTHSPTSFGFRRLSIPANIKLASPHAWGTSMISVKEALEWQTQPRLKTRQNARN